MKSSFLIFLFIVQASAFAQLTFTKITDPNNPIVNITSNPVYRGASWVDIDNDGDIDLFVCPSFLFRNDGKGNFSVVDNPIGQGQTQNPAGSSWADFDNDGDIDCFLARNPSRLYLNDGKGNFTVDDTVFNDLQNYPGWACSFADFNNDGRLDLIIAHPAGFLGPSFPSFFFIGQPDGTLKRDTSYFFTKNLEPYTVPYWSDFDMDGDEDLFIASGPGGSQGPDFLYKNLKTETGIDTLVKIRNLPFASANQDGQCYNFIDFDNDGDLDLFVTNWKGAPNRFYKNNNGSYEEIDVPFNYNSSSLANSWGDLDNDGDLDLIIANDKNKNTEVYINNGDGTFTLSQNSISSLIGSNSITLGDYDNDGDLDVFIMGDKDGRGLFRNDTQNNNNWVNILCGGTTSNKSAIGTKVKLKANISGNPVWQYREISAQNTFQGQNDLRVHFGLGNASMIDSVIIIYPSGSVETFTNVPVNSFYHNIEGSGSLSVITGIKNETGSIIPEGFKLFQNYPNPFNPSTSISYLIPNFAYVELKVFDILGKEVSTLINENQNKGNYKIQFDGSNLVSGIYFYKIDAAGFTQTRKMVLLK